MYLNNLDFFRKCYPNAQTAKYDFKKAFLLQYEVMVIGFTIAYLIGINNEYERRLELRLKQEALINSLDCNCPKAQGLAKQLNGIITRHMVKEGLLDDAKDEDGKDPLVQWKSLL